MSAPLLPGAGRVPRLAAGVVGAVVFLMVASAVSGGASPFIIVPVGVLFGLLTRAFLVSDEPVERIELGVALGVGVAAFVIGVLGTSTESEFQNSEADFGAFFSLLGLALGFGVGWLIGHSVHRHRTPQ